MNGITGRNFNIAIRTNEKIEDVGNIIVIEDEKIGAFAVELAIGITTLLKQKYNLDHILELNQVSSKQILNKENSNNRFEDSLITCTKLLGEGLRPFGNDNKSRILKKYLKSVLLHSINLGYTNEELLKYIHNTNFYNNKNDNIEVLIYELLSSYHQEIVNGKLNSNEDKLIFELINNQ
jgi:hypothetical protein